LGKNISMLVPAEIEAQSQALREQCRSDDSVRNVESVRRDRFGKAAPVLLTLSLLHDETGGPAAIGSISKDITAQKAAEAEAREAASRRDQFLAMLSHELRNPLEAILNASRLFDRVDGDVGLQRQASAVIQRQVEQMARLLDDLLDVARVTQGKIRIRNEVVDLRALVLEAAQLSQPLMEKNRHLLLVDVPDEPVFVEGDRARLLQVQQNLLANSAKYTPAGGRIRLTLGEEQDRAVLMVEDNGVGIDLHMREKIFELFVQAPQKLERIDSGMGIGLTMVRTIVGLHRGTVAARSDGLGKGSQFEVRLPLTAKRPPSASPTLPTGDSLRIVIVEDSADNRKLLETLLRLNGHQVTAAADGIQGYQTIAAQQPDVALVDIGLPGIDGYEVARKVRAQLADAQIRLVAMTGYGRASDHDAVLAAGFHEHLVKPVAWEDLDRVLRKPR
jgi:two-component system CheB/CheR fusion protein